MSEPNNHTEIYNPTAMREQYTIKDKNMVSLVKELFLVFDQAWVDSQAYEAAVLIDNYIKKQLKDF